MVLKLDPLLLSVTSAKVDKEDCMKRVGLLFPVAGLLLSMSLSHAALAQCGGLAKHIAYPMPSGSGGVRFQLAAATQTPDASSDEERWAHGMEPIVGMWKMDFEDPAHGYSDKGYSVWHSDHTEFMNSTRPPSVGAVCEGRVGEGGRVHVPAQPFRLGVR